MSRLFKVLPKGKEATSSAPIEHRKSLLGRVIDGQEGLDEDKNLPASLTKPTSAPLVAEVIEPPDVQGCVRLRWSTAEGKTHEQRLVTVRDLCLDRGDLVLIEKPSNWPEYIVCAVLSGDKEQGEVVVNEKEKAPVILEMDGKRIQLTGKEEVVLRCGQASLTLKNDGRVMIRGAHVETRATRTNRIRGGSVQIN